MIDAKTAVRFAKEHAVNMLGQQKSRLEEIELDTYKGRDVWRVTLGIPKPADDIFPPSTLAALGFGPLEYKMFLVDADDGGFIAMKLREPALQ
jgi:hypothetical protein